MINPSILFQLASKCLNFTIQSHSNTHINYISYGLAGLQIVLTELQSMYPNPAPNFKLPDGVSWNNFVQYVLVPEVVCMLISDDNSVTLEKAIQIWKDSREFGARAFPDELDS